MTGITQKDLWELYHDRLGLVGAVEPSEIWVRTSTEDRTMQVAGAMLAAMDPLVAGLPWPVYTEPASVSPCSRVSDMLNLLNNLTRHPDRLSRPSISMSRRDCGARSIPIRASLDGSPRRKCVSQSASGHCLWHSWAQCLGQLVCV